jgi:DNA-binding beta-propeller fold protein YncE
MRPILVLTLVLVCVACSPATRLTPAPTPGAGTVTPPPPPDPADLPSRPELGLGGVDPQLAPRVIQDENSLPGDPRWDRFVAKARNGEIEGYADRASAKAGDTVAVMVSATSAHVASWELIRMGWYGGALARVVASGGPYSVSPQPACPMDNYTGLIRCPWTTSFQIPISAAYLSGMYVIKLVRDDGYGSFVPLIIRDDRPAKLLFQSSVLTAQAYNPWHGESLYNDASKLLPWRHGVEVSFDRPYAEGVGAGQELRYEVYLVRFLEQYGYDVTYTTNLDVVAGGAAELRRHRAFLSVGHDEYWPGAERDIVEQARDSGVSLLFFSANSAYWQVRLTDDAGAGAGPRRVIGWKEAWASDPVQGPETTGRFRDDPINRPENALLGVMYGTWMNIRSPLVVADEHHWLFEGTGLGAGDTIPWLVGYESDGRVANGSEPAGLQVAAQTPTIAVDGYTSLAATTSYRAPSGALVFATGSIEWVWGLGYPGVADPRVARMTANVLHEAAGLRVPDSLPTHVPRPNIIVDRSNDDVRSVLRHRGAITGIATLPDGSLAVTESDHNRILLIGPPPNRDVSVLAGTGEAGAGDWTNAVPGASAQFRQPTGIIANAQGTLFVADTGNHCLRMIRNDAAHTVSTPDGYCGSGGYSEGAGRHALFNAPMGLALDPVTGDLLVADSWNYRVRRVHLDTCETETVFGGSEGNVDGPLAAAQVDFPTGLAFDPSGNLYVLSSGDFRVVRVSTGLSPFVTTIAGGIVGGDDGPGTSAGLAPELGIVWSPTGLLVSDASSSRIRRLVPGVDAASTSITTFAGAAGGQCRDGDPSDATFLMPLGLAIDAGGTVYVADFGNGAVRSIGR